MLVEIIQANAKREEISVRWLRASQLMAGQNKTVWIRYGLSLGVLSTLNEINLGFLLNDTSENPERLSLILRGGQQSFVESNEAYFESVVDHFLQADTEFIFRRSNSLVESFARALNPIAYGLVFQNRTPMPLNELWSRMISFNSESELILLEAHTHNIAVKCTEIVSLAQKNLTLPASDWATKLAPWNDLTELARDHFGDRWLLYVFANTASAIRSKEDICEEASDLHDELTPLCRRARYARLRAGASKWWETQINEAPNQEKLTFALLILFTWAGPVVIEKHFQLLDEKLNSLNLTWWLKLTKAVRNISIGFEIGRRDLAINPKSIPVTASAKIIVILSHRLGHASSDFLFHRQLENYSGDDLAILEFCQGSALRAAIVEPTTWHKWLPIISGAYMKGAISDQHFGYQFTRAIRGQKLPYKIAEEIIIDCRKYPTELVALAEQVCRQEVASKITPVGEISSQQNWFVL